MVVHVGFPIISNTVDQVTAGTIEAEKVMVPDSNKAIGDLGTLTFADSGNVVFGTTTGSKIGTAVSQKLGFYNATPIVQPAGSTQAIAATTAVTTASTTTTPAGYATTTQADNLAARVVSNTTLLNQIRADLIALGLIKGAA